MRAHDSNDSERLDPSVRQLVGLFGSLVVWALTYVTAISLLTRGEPSTGARVAAVTIGIGGLLPWVWMAARAIASQDEFTRRTHYVALSCTFAATGVFLFAVDLLTRAHLIDYVSYMHIWIFMVSAWLLALVLTNRYYR